MGKRVTIPLSILKGKWSAASGTSGDPSLMPDGYCIECRNVVVRANRLETRPPFVYDNLMNIRGITTFDDQTNKVSRLMAVDSTQAIYEKATSGDTWSASKGTLSGTRLTDACNYRGKLYGMMDNGSGLPTAAFSFDGTTLSTAPFSSTIQSRCVTPYLDRLFFAYPRETIAPLNAIADCYALYTASTGAVRTIVSGSITTERIFPDASGVGLFSHTILAALPTSTVEEKLVLRQDVRGVDATQDVTVTVTFQITPDLILRLTAYVAGDMRLDAVTSTRQRCITGGTTAVGAPAFNVTLGASTVDGTVTWITEGSTHVASKTVTVPPITTKPTWTPVFVDITLPPHQSLLLRSWIASGTATIISTGMSAGTSAAVPLDVSQKDAIADGDPRKDNHGNQLTRGDYQFPFVNTETATTSTVDLKSIMWSEVLQPNRIRASATYEPQELNGYPMAATTLGGRYLVFFRDGFIQFSGNPELTSADVIPIRRERQYKGVGCIGPRAHDQFEDVLYFIGEDGIYRMTVGSEHPEEIGGDAMREEIMSRGSNWVESQSTYNMPLLRIDKRNREVWVYTQKGTIYIYNIQSGAWTDFDVANNAEIADFYFNANTRKMYVAVGGQGLARVDWSAAAAQDTVESTLTNYSVTKDVIAKPIEFDPRADVCVERIAPYHLATASQTSQTLTASVSFDRGATYPYTDQITLDTTVPRNPIELYELAPSVTLKLSHVGKAGATIWAVSKIDAEVQVMSGEYPQVVPAGTASL